MAQAANAPTDRGLVWAYLLDRQGGASRVGWEILDSWTPQQGLLWVHFDISEPGPDTWLEERSGLEPQIAAALLAEDTRPRSAPSRNGLLVILRGVNLNPGAEPDDMVSVRVWLEHNRIITTRRRQLQANGAIKAALEAGEGPSGSGEFLDFLVEHLAPQRDALERLVRQPDPILTEQDNLGLREQADRVQRFIEDLDLIRERGLVSQEEFLSRIAYQQNQRIFVLSVVAAIFLPLTFLTGLMGMNVGGLPGANSPYGFVGAVGLMAALAGGVAYYFRRRRWL